MRHDSVRDVDGEIIGRVGAGESVYLDDGEWAVTAKSESDVVLFTTDPAAPVYKGGMFSGNVRAA
jgi:quercetin 2,3-dioxygenase